MEAINRAEFRKRFPNLAEELDGEKKVTIGGVRSDPKEIEKTTNTFGSYEPTVIDFLRRCETDEQGIEIIDYLKAKGEIEEEYANRLKAQLLQKGIESFGEKKKPGHYLIR